MNIRFNQTLIGDGQPVYIIAEAGSNHNGDFQQALRLVDAAVAAGANAVKFQTFKADRLYPVSAGASDYLQDARSIHNIIREMEMPDAWVPRLAAYCQTAGIEFMSSPFDEASADLLAPYVNIFKIASYEMTHFPLLRHVARIGKPMLVSTGTANIEEVQKSVEVLDQSGNTETILLQCTASYPTPPQAVNARAILALREATGHLVGLSDHSRDPIIAPVVAVALGACVIEKHFTLSNDLPGPDHRFAVTPPELCDMVSAVRHAEAVLGHGRKETLAEETELRSFARRSIFAIKQITPDEELGPANIAVLRCGKLGYGLDPAEYDNLVGHRVKRVIQRDQLVRWDDLV